VTDYGQSVTCGGRHATLPALDDSGRGYC